MSAVFTSGTPEQEGREAAPPAPRRGLLRRHPTAALGAAILVLLATLAILAPWIAPDPMEMSMSARLQPPSAQHWFGTDNFGRDIFARTLHGARISLAVGLTVALLAVLIGLPIGLVSGYDRRADAVLMRVMDGLMSIPTILLAIALVSINQASILIVIVAIAVPESPRIARLVRSVVLKTREMAFVEAAVSAGSRDGKIIRRHILPSTISPLIVQATYVVAAAVLVEAGLSFLGTGVSQETPTWGNMIAANRLYLSRAPWTIFFPGLFLTLTILAVNLIGDGLRDRLDPRLARQM
jgi:peptide/nickel transport system permease protein